MAILRKKLLIVFSVVAFFAFALSLFLVKVTKADGLIVDTEIAEDYDYGTVFVLPDGVFNVGGQNKAADVKLIFPSGKESHTLNNVLDEEGYYQVVFSAISGGEALTETKEFLVLKNNLTVSSANSSVSFGQYVSEEHNPSGYETTGNLTGALVTLVSGDKITYNKVLDLNGKTKNDIIAKVFVTPKMIGVMEYENLYIVLTDAYDPENYIMMLTQYTSENPGTVYCKGGFAGQSLLGIEQSSGLAFNDGFYPQYGYPYRLSFSGNTAQHSELHTIGDNFAGFSIDYSSKEIHHIYRTNNPNTVVCDLDNTEQFTEAWKGFTTGECFLSVYCDKYSAVEGNLVITEVFGEKITSVSQFTRTAPFVDIDFDGYDENTLPNGVVNTPYRLFDGYGKSAYFGGVRVDAKVFDPSHNEVTISGGTFTPTETGRYEIVYTAIDAVRNTGEYVYYVTVYGNVSAITVEPAEQFETAGIAGKEIVLPTVNAAGGSGRLDVRYSVKLGNADIEVKDGKFRPVSNGNYDITITSTDYLGNVGDYSYVVSVASGDKPVFIDQPILPKYIVSGKEYKLEKYFAYNYTDGSGDKISTTVTYTDGMGEKNAKADKIKPIVKTSGDLVIIKYSATLNGNTESVEYGIPVLILRDENGVLEVKDLFVAENGGYTEVDNSGVMLNFSKASVFGFVNPVAADNLDVRFCGTTDKIFYSKISFTISDFIDPSQSVKLNYIKTATGTRFYFNDNDGLTYACENDVFKNSNFITFNYNNNTMKFKYDKTKNSVGTAKEYCNGGSFAGFSSGLVYFTISVEDVTRVSSLTICSINGKTLMDEEYDYIGPRILFGSDYGGNVQINSVITAPSAKGVDIIDGVCDVKLTVKDVNGEFCYDVNGTLLNKVPADRDYLITADKYGTYTMSYYSEDADTNKTNFSFKVSVIDEEKPEIRVTGLPTEGKVGEKVIVPNATAIDNIDSDLTVITYFITPDGILYKLNTNAFIPKSVGKYIIRYSVRDRAGNLTIKDCPIVVK